ncbi:MAG: hypothetical protein IPI49_29905 [Myxococcales bacterium]|nr:hypothetical protein [Myxococcales bacterium]
MLSPDASVDAPVDAAVAPNPLTPDRLSGTGLCVDAACTQIAAGVRTFAPRWPLWTDGAVKERWIWLPPGKKIDNSDPNHWRFPVGTKLWKSFTVNGKRLETRYLVKLDTGDNHWFLVAYAWNDAQNEAVAVPRGQDNAGGTNHDIPSRADCRQCHDRVPGGVLGFSALALDYAAPGTNLDLEELASAGLLTAALPGSGSPRYPLPAGRNAQETQYAAEAVGYLHMNCGHCHNPDSPVYAGSPLELRLTTNMLSSWPATTVYTTAVGVTTPAMIDGASIIIKPAAPDESVVIKRMNHANPAIRMPAIGTEVVDASAQTLLRAWINSLPVN